MKYMDYTVMMCTGIIMSKIKMILKVEVIQFRQAFSACGAITLGGY